MQCEPRETPTFGDMGVSNNAVSWTSKFVTMVLQENRRRSDVTFLVLTFWTHPYGTVDSFATDFSCNFAHVFLLIVLLLKNDDWGAIANDIWVRLETLNAQRDSSKTRE